MSGWRGRAKTERVPALRAAAAEVPSRINIKRPHSRPLATPVTAHRGMRATSSTAGAREVASHPTPFISLTTPPAHATHAVCSKDVTNLQVSGLAHRTRPRSAADGGRHERACGLDDDREPAFFRRCAVASSWSMQTESNTLGTVLVVDDERVLLIDLQRTLQRFGYPLVAIAASGDEALRVAESAPPTIVLMDLRLRGRMDGIETVQHLRARHSFRLIYLTGGVDEQQRIRAENTAPDAWLTKPYDHAQLRRALEMAGEQLSPASGL
jgi:two-component system, response regulator PdtaR